MSEIKIGARLKDNDPRCKARPPLVIHELRDGKAHCVSEGYGPSVKIRLDRIHEDGKLRRSGFSVLPPNA